MEKRGERGAIGGNFVPKLKTQKISPLHPYISYT